MTTATVNLTFIDETTNLDELLAPYANTRTFSDAEMNLQAKRLSRSIRQGKPENIVNHYRAALVERAAQIIMLLPADEHILLIWDDKTDSMLSAARKAWNKACKVMRDDAEYDAIAKGRAFDKITVLGKVN